MIGSIEINVEEKKIASPGSMALFAARIMDAKNQVLLRKSDVVSVDMAVMERVADGTTGAGRFEPEEIPWRLLLSDEYELFDEIQPAGLVSAVPYTFLFQPSGDHWPMFPYAGIFEVWFRFKRVAAGDDDLRLIYVVNVGNQSGARRV